MKWVKQYILPLLTFLLIAAGAAMPFAVSWVQDNRISGLQEEFPLSTVNLKLQQDIGVSPALRLISGECSSILWEEETQLTKQEAVDAGMTAVQKMTDLGLLFIGDQEMVKSAEGRAEPILLIGEDGSSALVWNCYWSSEIPCLMWIDDAAGKAVQFLVSCPTPRDTDDAHVLLANWTVFFQEYYGVEIVSVKEESRDMDSGGILYQCIFEVDLQDGLDVCELKLELFDGMATFNFN